MDAGNDRESEIKRKIDELKQKGRIKQQPSNDSQKQRRSVSDEYGARINQKLGARRARLMGIQGDYQAKQEWDELDLDDDDLPSPGRQAKLGSLSNEQEEPQLQEQAKQPVSETKGVFNEAIFNSLDDDDDDDEEELSEEDMIELVAEKLAEKRATEKRESEARMKEKISELSRKREQQQELQTAGNAGVRKTTSGVGGSWAKNETTPVETYKPSKSGTWGVFDRPKDISKTFGGGKRVGAGYTKDDIARKQKSEEDTRDKLRQYREKAGIDVQSEKDHAKEIEQALAIAQRAMERGIYATAVSALEKVTIWCSTNSPVGGNVFLELGMAYEAVGRTEEAITVYTALSSCRMESIKYNAKRLLYGIEAIQFMRDEACSPSFSRNKIRNTFIDTTGLANIAQNFDDVYNTAYIDMSSGFYKKLSESVVRSNREARQILMQATGPGEVSRTRIVQALRSISRHFDDALEEEIENLKPAPEPQAFIDGKPIVVSSQTNQVDRIAGMGEYSLASPEQMMTNLDGEWRLQLLADRRGDGVSYFNNTLAWQQVDTNEMQFQSSGQAGFLKVAQTGGIEFTKERRILQRTNVEITGGGMLAGMLAGSSGAAGAVNVPIQIMTVDSILLLTRMAPDKRIEDSQKEYFGVWRRVARGTYSNGRQRQ